MDPTLKVFLLGGAGALAPEIVRLWSIAQNRGRFTWSGFYIVVSLLFAALGGLVAVVMGSENIRSAFYSGVSTPVIVNTVLKKASAGRRRKAVKGAAAAPRLSRLDSFLEAL
jgi:hypothetical protein